MAFYRQWQAIVSQGTFVLAVAVMGAAILGLSGLWLVERELIARAGESLAIGAVEVADRLDATFQERTGDLEILATASQVRSSLNPMAVSVYLETVQRAYPVYSRLAITNQAGKIVAATDREMIGRNMEQSPWYQAALHHSERYVGIVRDKERRDGELLTVVFSAPIQAADGAFLGAIMTEVDRALVQEIVESTVRQFAGQPSNFGRVDYRVVTSDGALLLNSDEGERDPEKLRELGEAFASNGDTGQSGYVEEEHLVRHVPVVTGYARLKGSLSVRSLQWGVLVRVYRSGILRNIQGVLLKLALVGVAGFIPMVGLVVWANRSQRQAQWKLSDSEARLGAVVTHAADGIVSIDQSGRILSFNPAAETLFGYRAGEVLGCNVSILMPEPYASEHDGYLAAFCHTGKAKIIGSGREVVGRHRNGLEFPLDLSVSEFPFHGQRCFMGTVRDITQRVQADRDKRVRLALTSVFSRKVDEAELPIRLLEAVGTSVGWAVGIWWEPDSAGRLSGKAFWAADRSKSARFIDETARFECAPGVGLPGRVWQSGQPAWIMDVLSDKNFPRAESARVSGLHAALAIPIPYRGAIGGVLEFFSSRRLGLDESLLAIVDWVGSQIGSVLEQRAAEQAQRESDVRARSVIENALDAVVMMDRAGRIIEWNRPAEQMFGWSRAEVLGRDLADTMVPLTQRDAHRAGLAQYLATGEGRLLNRQIEVAAARRTGEEFAVELSICTILFDGAVIFSAFIRDITERKQMVEQLNERETYFRLLSEQLPVGVFEVTAAGRCVYRNRMANSILGCDEMEARSAGLWEEWFSEADRAVLTQAWDMVVSASEPLQHECRVAGRDSEEQWVQVSLWPMATDTGVRYLGTLEDITARKRTIARTMQLLRQGKFELQTLSEARNLAELLAAAFPDPSRAQLGLTELLVNGVEHGNLSLSYTEKSALLEAGLLEDEMARRLVLPENLSKRVRVSVDRTETELTLAIVDEGLGFDWARYLVLDEVRADDMHGRGIAMTKEISFDRMEYRNAGNHVIVSTDLPLSQSGGDPVPEPKAA